MEKDISKILRNAGYLLCMNLSNLFALFVFSVLLTRTLGKETLGLYTFFTAALMPFVYFIDFGQSNSLIQEIGKAPNRTLKILRNTLSIKVLLTAIATTLLVVFSALFFEHNQERQMFWIFGLILLPRAFYSSFEATLRAHQKMGKLLYVSTPIGITLVCVSWLLLKAGFELEIVLAFLVAVEFLKAGLIWLVLDRTLGLNLRLSVSEIEWGHCLKLLRNSLPFFTIGIVGILHYRLDIVVLAYMKDNTEVGIFGGASNFANVLRFSPSVIVAAFFPAISSLSKNSLRLNSLTKKALTLQLFASVALSTAVFVLAPFLLSQTYRIEESVAVLRMLVWSVIPMSVYSTLIYVFYQADKSSWSLKILSGAVVVNVILNILLIPQWGAMALAFSRLISESFCLVIAAGLYFRFLFSSGTETTDHEAIATDKVPALGCKLSN